MEALAGTLALRPVQRKPWPLLKAIDFMWRAPATIFFVVFLGEAVCLPYFLSLASPPVPGIRPGGMRCWASMAFFEGGRGDGEDRDPFMIHLE